VTSCPNPKEVLAYLSEVRPTWFFAVPRIWEKLKAGLETMFAALPDEGRAQAEQALAGGEADGTDGEQAHHEEDEQGPVAGRLAVAVRDETVCDQEAQAPVDGQCSDTAAGAGQRTRTVLRQAELFPPVSEVGTGVLHGRARPREP